MFRWSRKTYRQAAQLNRLTSMYTHDDCVPEPLKQYRRLWLEHSATHYGDDPLSKPLHERLAYFKGEDIPF